MHPRKKQCVRKNYLVKYNNNKAKRSKCLEKYKIEATDITFRMREENSNSFIKKILFL